MAMAAVWCQLAQGTAHRGLRHHRAPGRVVMVPLTQIEPFGVDSYSSLASVTCNGDQESAKAKNRRIKVWFVRQRGRNM